MKRSGSASPGGWWRPPTWASSSFATAEGPVADVLRTRIAPLVLSKVVRIEAAREFLFRMVSQITLNYRGGPLSAGVAGRVRGGDRLPWVSVEGQDNFASLADIGLAGARLRRGRRRPGRGVRGARLAAACVRLAT